MIAYNKTELENQLLIEEAHSLYKAGFISKENYNTTEEKLPTSKNQKNILIRLGMAFLGILLYASICGFITLLGLSQIDNHFTYLIYIYAIVGFAGTEFFAQQNYKGQGLDDTFLFGGQMLLATAIGATTEGYEMVIAFFTTLIAFVCFVRYINRMSALIFCISSILTIYFAMIEVGGLGLSFLPFIIMIYAVILYLISSKIARKITFPLYHKGILLLKNFSLVLFYLSGNYFVIRELSYDLLGDDMQVTSEMPLAWLFYAFTIIVPGIYIFYGLKNKEKMFLWTGFGAILGAIFTIRYYHHVFSTGVMLSLSGIILFIVAYFSIKKLKDKKSGITFMPDRFVNSSDFIGTEALILTSQFGLKPEVSPDSSPMEYGGGDFSGGGSGGSF